MKKFKKLNSGMTLVEVVIAMAVFSTMTLGITMAFSAAIKYNARNVRRDYELNTQQTSIEKASAAGVEVFNSSYRAMTLNFVDASTSTILKTVSDVTEYNAIKSAQNGSDFNFELKSLSSSPLGSTKVAFDTMQNQYKISFSNLSTKPADVRIIISNGSIYEGNPTTGYRHSSSLYKRTIAGIGTSATDVTADDSSITSSSGFEIGFECDLTQEASSMEVIVYQDGSRIYDANINNTSLAMSLSGELNFTIPVAGGSVTVG
jgi:prepilin-type N-terminal cleavage/methylation domain-containing protein